MFILVCYDIIYPMCSISLSNIIKVHHNPLVQAHHRQAPHLNQPLLYRLGLPHLPRLPRRLPRRLPSRLPRRLPRHPPRHPPRRLPRHPP